MKSTSTIGLGLACLLTACAFLSIAATPPRKQTQAFTLQVIAVDGDSVRVSPPEKGSGAVLRLRLRKEAQPELKDSLSQLKPGRVRIMAGGRIVTETRLAGIVGGDRDKLVGLVLSFKTLEEANEVAAALRLSPRELSLVLVNHWVQAAQDCASCDLLTLWPSAPEPGR